MKKIKFVLIVFLLLVMFVGCIYYVPETNDGAETETTHQTDSRSHVYKISIQNVETGTLYPYSLDIGESFYLYIKPYYYSLSEGSKSSPDDIALIATTDPDSVKIEFVEIRSNGDFLYKVTTVKEGYCKILAVDRDGEHETGFIEIDVFDYSKAEKMKYKISTKDNLFHYPSCKVYSYINLQYRLPISMTRNELRDQGYVPCKDCCG